MMPAPTASTAHQQNAVRAPRRRTETALDWFQRCKRRRRRRVVANGNDDRDLPDHLLNTRNRPWWATLSRDATGGSSCVVDNPTMAALHFLLGGNSGIAPMDVAWRYGVSQMAMMWQQQHGDDEEPQMAALPPSPIVILEGPKDVGKTWMLLSLAARFVVDTRPSLFSQATQEGTADETLAAQQQQLGHQQGNNDYPHQNYVDLLPQVILLDSNIDFCISKLVHLVRSTLSLQEGSSTRVPPDNPKDSTHSAVLSTVMDATNTDDVSMAQSLTTEKVTKLNASIVGSPNFNASQNFDHIAAMIQAEGDAAEMRHSQREAHVEECLSRIHVIHVDNGTADWVPVLEILRHHLSEKAQCQPPTSFDTPTLLLWDGFLSDIPFYKETNIKEILQQMTRLLNQESNSLWWVLSSRNPTMTTGNGNVFGSGASRIGQRIIEWMKQQQHQRREKMQNVQSQRSFTHPYLWRQTCRVRLDRHFDASSGNSKTANAYKATLLDANDQGRSNTACSSHHKTKNGEAIGDYQSTIWKGNYFPNVIRYSLSLEGILS